MSEPKHIFDILYHDGPYTSVFQNDTNYTIWNWSFDRSKYSFWNTFDVTRDILIKYLRKEISFYELVKNATNHKSNMVDAKSDVISSVDIEIKDCLPENDYTYEDVMSGPYFDGIDILVGEELK